MIVRITLPFPITVNQLYGGGSGQQRFPSKKYKLWLARCPELEAHRFERAKIQYLYFFPDDRARDTANLEKCVTDYLVKQKVIVDDSWKHIQAMVLIPMGIDRENPRVEILLDSSTNI